jgi:hypothetical protein
MGTFFQVKRVIKKMYGRRKLIANVWKRSSQQPLVILDIMDPQTNIRTVQNLIFYLEPHYFVAIRSKHASFWLRFFTYLVPFRNVTIHPFVSAAKAVKILRTSDASKSNKQLPVHLVDQPKDLHAINVPYYKHPGFCWPVNKQPQKKSGNRSGFIFMAGNVNPALYDHPNFNRKYGIPNRHQVYLFLKNSASTVSDVFFDENKDAGSKKIFIHTLASSSLSQENYIQYLQQFNCVICAPGVTMPLCHNLIEAMEYGCIPIFSYPEWLPTGLIDGENCFIYKSLEEMEQMIIRISTLQDDDFRRIRENLATYYHEHFLAYSLNLEIINEIVILNENKQMLDDK